MANVGRIRAAIGKKFHPSALTNLEHEFFMHWEATRDRHTCLCNVALTATRAITKVFQGKSPTDLGIAALVVQSQGDVRRVGAASAHVTGNDLEMAS